MSGCYVSHGFAASDAGAPADAQAEPDAGAPAPPPVPAVCLSPGSLAIRLGPERTCVRRDLVLRAEHSCLRGVGRVDRGVPFRLFRERPGRVDLRLEGVQSCAWVMHALRELDCGGCSALMHTREAIVPGTQLPFPDSGLLELLLAPGGDDPGACGEVRLTACFDPDYEEPSWDP